MEKSLIQIFPAYFVIVNQKDGGRYAPGFLKAAGKASDIFGLKFPPAQIGWHCISPTANVV
jgi:hypothetical protein